MTVPSQATWVRFPRFVGDAAMQLPVLRLLRMMDVGPIVVWGPAPAVSLVEDHPLADAVVPDQGKPSPFDMARLLKAHRAACSIHFPKSLRPALAAFLARVPRRIGVNESLAGLFNTVSGPFWEMDGPFLLRYHAVLKKAWPDAPDMPFADYDPGVAIEAPARPYLCVMPGSTWPSKTWPAEHFRALTRRAQAEGLDVVILGVPSEAGICAAVAQDATLNLCGRTSLKEAAAWMRGAWAVVGNDSGLSHLAAACGTPALGLYGATDPGGSTPWGPRTASLRVDGLPCAPCFKRECTVSGHPCLRGLHPDRVWEELQALLAR